MPWPQICQKPAQTVCYKYVLQYHPVTNTCFQREWDEISHWSRNQLTFLIYELDLFITLLASIGALNIVAKDSEIPTFTEIFSSPEGAGIALLIFFAVPIVLFIIELIYEAIIGYAEKDETNIWVRRIIYLFFWFSIVLIFLLLIALLLGLGLTDRESVIQVAAVIWGVRLFINWLIWKPCGLSVLYCCRKQFGKTRTAKEEPKRCPGVFCCKE